MCLELDADLTASKKLVFCLIEFGQISSVGKIGIISQKRDVGLSGYCRCMNKLFTSPPTERGLNTTEHVVHIEILFASIIFTANKL